MNSIQKVAVALSLASMSLCSTAAERDLSCTLAFSGKAWSVMVERGEGSGTVTCEDGSTLPVSISAKGIGITVGKWSVDSGKGKFSDVRQIDDVLGSYAALSVDAGMHDSGTAQVLSKGKVSLALEGTGKGFDLGIAVNNFRIERAAVKPTAN